MIEVKGQMLRILGRLRAKEMASTIQLMQNDTAQLKIYEHGVPVETTIGALAREAIQMIEAEGEK